MTFAVPKVWQDRQRDTHRNWYCPNGHEQHYPSNTELERTQKELARLKRRAEYLEADRDTLERSRSAVRGHLTRVRQRESPGVCPCCKRTFQNVARHMKTRHPDYESKAT